MRCGRKGLEGGQGAVERVQLRKKCRSTFKSNFQAAVQVGKEFKEKTPE